MIRDGSYAGWPTLGASGRDDHGTRQGCERCGRHTRDKLRATEAVGNAEASARVFRSLRGSARRIHCHALAGALNGHAVASRVSDQVGGNGSEEQEPRGDTDRRPEPRTANMPPQPAHANANRIARAMCPYRFQGGLSARLTCHELECSSEKALCSWPAEGVSAIRVASQRKSRI